MNKQDFINQNFGFFGCSCYDECPKELKEDNLVLLGLNYHGRYEDDDCGFWYINAKTGEFSRDGWTTAGACPAFSSYLRIWWQDAIEKGLIDKDMVWNLINQRWNDAIEAELKWIEDQPSFWWFVKRYIGYDGELNVPCVVGNRCRDYKGEGILLRFEQVEDSYTGDTITKAKVLGKDGKIYTMGHQLAQVDIKAIADKFRAMVDENFMDTVVWRTIFPMQDVDLTEAKDVKLEAKKAEYLAFKEKKMPGLIEWCRSVEPTKSDDEIKEWAEKIFDRKYPMR